MTLRALPGRGRTRPGRLTAVDAWIVQVAAEPLGRRDGRWASAVVVDVGIGARPDTTLEFHRRLRREWPTLSTVGVDVVEERVAALTALEEEGLQGRVGGVRLPLTEDARLVRAANLLRQVRLAAVDAALRELARPLLDRGLLIEGSTDDDGDVAVFRALQGPGRDLVEIAFFCGFARGFSPHLLTAWLPRGLGWYGHPGPEVAPLFAAWRVAFDEVRAAGLRDPPETFRASAALLSRRVAGVRDDPDGWAAGCLRWAPG